MKDTSFKFVPPRNGTETKREDINGVHWKINSSLDPLAGITLRAPTHLKPMYRKTIFRT